MPLPEVCVVYLVRRGATGLEVLLGDASAGEPDPAEWAELAGTLPHDILTGFGARVERTAVNLA